MLLGRKVVTKLDSVLKSKDITLPTKMCTAKAMVFPVIMYRCESWTIKNWYFQTVVLEKILGESLGLQGNQTSQSYRKPVLNIHWNDWCWSWNSNTLATWCEELTHWKRPWCWERLRTEEKGATEDKMVRCYHQLNGHDLSKLQEIVKGKEAGHAAVHGVVKNQTRLSDWTTTTDLTVIQCSISAFARIIWIVCLGRSLTL